MSLLFLFVLICSLSYLISSQVIEDEIKNAFIKWKCDFGVNYSSNAQEKTGLNYFAENHKFVKNHNQMYKKGLAQYSLGLWEESDQPLSSTNSKFNNAKIQVEAKSKSDLNYFFLKA